MLRRFTAVALALLLLVPTFLVPSYATNLDPTPVATFIKDLSSEPEALYMGTGEVWGYDSNSIKLQFANAADVGTVTYQWYRADGEYPLDADFEAHFVPDTREGSSGTAVPIDAATFTMPVFYRDISVAGAFTYCVVFTNTVGSAAESFKSTQRVTYVTPQVLFMKSQTYDDTVAYYFEGAPAPELSITLKLPDVEAEADEANYGTIKYQWYKSSVATSDFVYDDFPFFDEDTTPAISGASGTIDYDDAADANGATITYTPVNDEVGEYHYWPFVYDECNGVISYTPNIIDAVVNVLPSPVTSIARQASSATVHLAVTLPEGKTVDPEYGYLLVSKGSDPGENPTYTTGTLENAAAALNLTDLTDQAYDLYLKFTDNEDTQWSYKASVPRYYDDSDDDYTPPPAGNPIDVSTTDGNVKGQGTMTTTATGSGKETTVTITSKSFSDMSARAAANGVGMQINTPNAKITFDETAVAHLGELAASHDAVLKVNLTDSSKLPEKVQAVVGDHPVYNFSMTIGGTRVSSFDGGTATISIPYTLSPGEKPEAVVIYYIDDTGNLVTVNGAYNTATGTVDFTVKHFSYYAVGYNLVSFSDVLADAWYYKAATFIAARGITTGVGGDLFAPDAVITRGQFITMLLRAYEIAPDIANSDNFSDAGNTFYTNYLSAAKRLGIAKGIGGNLFAPESSISRQDMYTLLYRALDVLGELPEATKTVDFSAYTDGGTVADYAKDAFESLIAGGIVTGSDGQLRPAATATRAEMAMVLYRLLSA